MRVSYSALIFAMTLSPHVGMANEVAMDSAFEFNLSDIDSIDDLAMASVQADDVENINEKWNWSGSLSFRNQYGVVRSEWLSNRLRGDLESIYKYQQWTFFANAQLDFDPAVSDYRDTTRFELREIYSTYADKGASITIGKQRLAWGTVDGRSTIDRVNAIDFREPISNGRTAARRPSWLIAVEQSSAIGVWQAVWLPRGKDRKLPEHNSPWETRQLNQLRNAAIRGDIQLIIEDPHKDEWGVRFTHYGQGIDWGAAVFDGYTDGFTTVTTQNTRVRLHPDRIRTWNINMALGLAESTWRGELAYIPGFPVNNGEAEGLTQLIIGWDKIFFTDLYANIQLFWEHHSKIDNVYGMTFAFTNRFFDGAVEVGLRGQLSEQSQYSIELFMDYAINDIYFLNLRAFAFGGNEGSDTAEFGNNDFIELGFHYHF